MTLHSRGRYYEAHVWHQKKQVHLGSFASEGDAALCVDVATRILQPSRPESDFNLAPEASRAKLTDLGFAGEDAATEEGAGILIIEATRRWGRRTRNPDRVDVVDRRPLWRPRTGASKAAAKRRAATTPAVTAVAPAPPALPFPAVTMQPGGGLTLNLTLGTLLVGAHPVAANGGAGAGVGAGPMAMGAGVDLRRSLTAPSPSIRIEPYKGGAGPGDHGHGNAHLYPSFDFLAFYNTSTRATLNSNHSTPQAAENVGVPFLPPKKQRLMKRGDREDAEPENPDPQQITASARFHTMGGVAVPIANQPPGQ